MKANLFLLIGLVSCCQAVFAQVDIRGTVYDQSQRFPMPGVSVVSRSGTGTMTDSLGRYHIRVSPADSISFSYLGRVTSPFPVKEIPVGVPFDMSLAVAVDSLPTVLVREPNYRLDSLANRKEYQKVFDYAPSYLKNMKAGNPNGRKAGFGVGLDLNMILNPKENRRMLALQDRLEYEEKEGYIDHRWNRALVRRITGLEAPRLDSFMREYRPSYEFIKSCETDYEFYKYIQEWGRFFEENWKVLHKDE